jgi:two-component system, OmpR family, phosphate regulon response regulator PhoB
MSASILVIEDEEPLQVLLRYNLESEGYKVRHSAQGEEALYLISDEKPDLILLDWMLPGISGIEVCRLIRARPEARDIPIIMLTARSEEAERVRGLATGADDYLVKPFSVPELLARIKTILRRVNPDAVAEQLKAGDLVLDRKTRRVNRGVRDINLSPTEFRLLEQLMKNPGRVYSRSQLLDTVWGRDAFVDERTVDVHVGRLRKSLSRGRETDPVRTIRAMGYAFDERFGRTA